MTRSKWEEAWDRPDTGQFGWYRSQVEPFIVEAAARSDLPSGVALDVGCGAGQVTHFLGGHFPLALGLDFAFPALVLATADGEGANARFGVADASYLPLRAGCASIVVDRGCMHCLTLDEAPGYLSEVARVLAPGGRFALVARTAMPVLTFRAALRSPRRGARRVVDRLRKPRTGLISVLRSVDALGALLPDALVIEHAEYKSPRSDAGWRLRHLQLVARRVDDESSPTAAHGL